MKKFVYLLLAVVLLFSSSIVFANDEDVYEKYISDYMKDEDNYFLSEDELRYSLDRLEELYGVEHEYIPYFDIAYDFLIDMEMEGPDSEVAKNIKGLDFFAKNIKSIIKGDKGLKKHINTDVGYMALTGNIQNQDRPVKVVGTVSSIYTYRTYGDISCTLIDLLVGDDWIKILYLGDYSASAKEGQEIEFNVVPITLFRITEFVDKPFNTIFAVSGFGLQYPDYAQDSVPLLNTSLDLVDSFFDFVFANGFRTFLFCIFGIVLFILLDKLIYKIYENAYFNGEEFQALKEEISSYVDDCNQLNQHIESLKYFDSLYNQKDYGVAKVYDSSNYNYKRRELNKLSGSQQVYNCSLSVCRSAQNKPFDYICKYFNIPKDEESLEYFEELFNNFSAADEGRLNLLDKEKQILNSIYDRIPKKIKKKSADKIPGKLGFHPVNLSDVHFPNYKFLYVSDGGNSSLTTDVTMDLTNLERFIEYLNEHIKWRQSVKGQRALMTPALRNKIKERDNYTCCSCHNSIEKEPNLLLEIDHIIPVSKGGLTAEDNLQTLCWKCNRSKSDKIL